ncbi:hypothetical protein MAR_001688 [Mya arenaria]|uniref:Mab-21-like HhH/H2TH-like domain-containing protein n=1 Tax=Mya arenaria TaxID=6604 RepID=A0ABY7FCE4_MYAAR|nr:uncharacterized protein LOC128207667 [Mya arenaria]WAR19850.1 hypothetical protein MAR_001688 [Mya arenaria]
MSNTEYLRQLSVCLFGVLDKAGASEYVRKLRQNGKLVSDVLVTMQLLFEEREVGVYTFGSACEGTTTPGMNSDEDIMMCFLSMPVFEKEEDIDEYYKEELQLDRDEVEFNYALMLIDDYTPVGFTKLQFVKAEDDDCIITLSKDANGIDVVVNSGMLDAMDHDERNGPAGTTLKRPGFSDLDHKPSFRCRKWPRIAEEFFTRERKYGFPSQDVRHDFGKYGIFFVPTGHSESPEKHLQWRLSYSLQERKIMLSLSETQYKCYVLLKMVKEDFVKPVVSGKSLTSYQCKTSMFFCMETTDTAVWVEENLIACFIKCVHLLKRWISKGFVPSYFMPLTNIWKGDACIRQRVVDVLDRVLQDAPGYLFKLRCDRVGIMLKDEFSPTRDEDGLHMSNGNHIIPNNDACQAAKRVLHLAVYNLHYKSLSEVAILTRHLMLLILSKNDTIARAIVKLRRFIKDLQNAERVADMSLKPLEDTQYAMHFVLPYVFATLGSHLALNDKLTGRKTLSTETIQFLEKGLLSDALSGSLKYATALYALEQYEDCLKILRNLDANLQRNVISQRLCVDRDITTTILVNEELLEKVITEEPTLNDVLTSHMATCVMFQPTEIGLLPRELQYEMFRSCFTETDALYWFDYVVVDAKILLYYLLYRVHKKLNHDECSDHSFLWMISTLEDDYNLCHFETAMNLIGCIWREKEKPDLSMKAFRNSWTRRPEHNAAKWHVALMCFEHFQSKRLGNDEFDRKEGGQRLEKIIYSRV